MIIALITLCTVWLLRFHQRYLVWEDDSETAEPVQAKPNFPVVEHNFADEDDRGKELDLTTELGDGRTQLGVEKRPLPEERVRFFLKAAVENDDLPDQVLPEQRQTAMEGRMEEEESRFQAGGSAVAADDTLLPAAELVGMVVGATQSEAGFLWKQEASGSDKKKTSR